MNDSVKVKISHALPLTLQRSIYDHEETTKQTIYIEQHKCDIISRSTLLYFTESTDILCIIML